MLQSAHEKKKFHNSDFAPFGRILVFILSPLKKQLTSPSLFFFLNFDSKKNQSSFYFRKTKNGYKSQGFIYISQAVNHYLFLFLKLKPFHSPRKLLSMPWGITKPSRIPYIHYPLRYDRFPFNKRSRKSRGEILTDPKIFIIPPQPFI